MYSGRVTASILIDDLRVGDTLDISYSTYGQNPVFGGKYIGLTGWDQSAPTLLRRVILNHPADRKIAWRMIGDRPAEPIAPRESTHDGMRRLEFTQQSLHETIAEALTPRDFVGFRLLQFSEFSSWSDVANWANALFPAAGIGDELQAEVQKIRKLDSDQAMRFNLSRTRSATSRFRSEKARTGRRCRMKSSAAATATARTNHIF